MQYAHHPTSVRMTELVINTGEGATWTDAGANVTATAETDTYKVGAGCQELAIAAAQGVTGDTAYIAYGASAAAATNINTTWYAAAYNYIKLWLKSDVILALGNFTIGLDNAATFNTAVGAGHRDWNIPAIPVANTWYRCPIPCPRTLTDGTELASIDTVGLKMVTDVGACNLWLDDIRLCKYEFSGSVPITLPTLQTLGNTDLDTEGALTDLFILPFRANRVTIHELDQDATITYYLGTVGAWASGDLVVGADYLKSGQTVVDLEREATAIAVKHGSALATGEHFSMTVAEVID